jgi:hypothetical protein
MRSTVRAPPAALPRDGGRDSRVTFTVSRSPNDRTDAAFVVWCSMRQRRTQETGHGARSDGEAEVLHGDLWPVLASPAGFDHGQRSFFAVWQPG